VVCWGRFLSNNSCQNALGVHRVRYNLLDDSELVTKLLDKRKEQAVFEQFGDRKGVAQGYRNLVKHAIDNKWETTLRTLSSRNWGEASQGADTLYKNLQGASWDKVVDLVKGAHPSDLAMACMKTNEQGDTTIHTLCKAAGNQNQKVLALLTFSRMSGTALKGVLTRKNKEGRTPLQEALQHNQHKILEALLYSNSKALGSEDVPNGLTRKKIDDAESADSCFGELSAKDKKLLKCQLLMDMSDQEALGPEAVTDFQEVVKGISKEDLINPDNFEGKLLLHSAVSAGNLQAVAAILDKVTTEDEVTYITTVVNKNGQNMAAFMRDDRRAKEIQSMITEKKAALKELSPEVQNRKQLEGLCQNHEVSEADLGIIKGYSVDQLLQMKSGYGKTPFHIAMEEGNVAVLKALLGRVQNQDELFKVFLSQVGNRNVLQHFNRQQNAEAMKQMLQEQMYAHDAVWFVAADEDLSHLNNDALTKKGIMGE